MNGEGKGELSGYIPVALDPQSARLELDRLLPLGDSQKLGQYGRAVLDYVSGSAGPDVVTWVERVEMLKGIVNSQYDKLPA